MRLTYPACFYPDEEQEGSYAVVVPDLPGCVSGGNTVCIAISRKKGSVSFTRVGQGTSFLRKS